MYNEQLEQLKSILCYIEMEIDFLESLEKNYYYDDDIKNLNDLLSRLQYFIF